MREKKQNIQIIDPADQLFDPNYYKDVMEIRDRGFIREDEEARFDGENKLIGNEKYIRRFTMEVAFVYKSGGLIIGEDWCHYEEGYISPQDLLYYAEGWYVGTVSLSELVVYAMHLDSPDDDDEKDFTIIFRSTKTGNFYVIYYRYSEYYLASMESQGEDYFRYFATEYSSSVESEVHALAAKGELTLVNNPLYLGLRRAAKINAVLRHKTD